MIRFIKIDGETAEESRFRKEQINHLLYRILRPEDNPEGISDVMFHSIIHPNTGYAALMCDMNYNVKINNMNQATILMQSLVGKVPQVALDARLEHMRNHVNNEIPFSEIIPNSETLFTRDDMVADGWLPPEEVFD